MIWYDRYVYVYHHVLACVVVFLSRPRIPRSSWASRCVPTTPSSRPISTTPACTDARAPACHRRLLAEKELVSGQEEPCVAFGSAYPGVFDDILKPRVVAGMADVAWAKHDGMVHHPEWYPELSSGSSDQEVAAALYMSWPCDRIRFET